MNRSIKVASPSLDMSLPVIRMTVEAIAVEPGDRIPNHPYLPVLLYRHAVASGLDAAAEFEARFRRNGWQGIWQDGIFDYQHYHTGAHEVLGIGAGRARLLIGGPDGYEIAVHAGDCLVLPAGTGHQNLEASRDFSVVGAYPPSQQVDIETGPADDLQRGRIARLSLPETDPVEGTNGPLTRLWTRP